MSKTVSNAWGTEVEEKPDVFWMVFVDGRDGPRHRHETEAEARAEAERVARLPENVGKRVFTLKATAFCQVGQQPVTWHELPR